MLQIQIQKTKTVIARQLSQRELNNYFFPRPYPWWAWGLAVFGPILIGVGFTSKLWFLSIAGLIIFPVGLLYLLNIKRGNPDDRLYDAWVENQGHLLAQKGFHVLDITRSLMSDRLLHMRSYVLPGSIDAADYNPNAVLMKRGKDGELRFSINVCTYIYPLKDALAIFKGDINALDPRFQNDQDEIYPYHVLAGVSMMSNPRDRIVMGGQKYPYRIQQFCLKLNNGERIKLSAAVKARPPGGTSGIPIIALPDTGFNRTFNILRKLLLSANPYEYLPSIDKIRQAINNQSFSNYFHLGNAITQRLGATEPISVASAHFERNTVWEISLPSIGLRLTTQKALFYIRKKEKERIFYEYLAEAQQEREAAFIFIVDIMDIHNSPLSVAPRMIWVRQQDLIKVIELPEKSLLGWLGRLITSQVDVESLLPYRAKGAVIELFFGREYELERLIGGNQHGGIIIGAHRSGKTSLLHNIGERLKRRGRTVVGPFTFTGVGSFQFFFESTLRPLAIDCSIDMSPELWASSLRKAYAERQQKERFVFLLDEVDDLLKIDFEVGSILGRQMRSLQSDGQCEFYLAGHKALPKAIALEEGPLQNFAEEVILTGLTQKASMRLIQEPTENLGFSISDEQALKIFQGTAGVAVLIQEFCIRLLCRGIPSTDKSEVEDRAIDDIEKSPDYLNAVFDHYKYGQNWTSLCIMLITAMHKEVSRQDLMQEIDKHGIKLSRSQLDESLKFLTKFGVLEEKELKPGYYSILPTYLSLAIVTRDPDMLLNEKIEEGKKEMCHD